MSPHTRDDEPADRRSIVVAGSAAGRRNGRGPDCSRLPVASATIDLAVLAMAAHELRAPAERVALFEEIRRVLTPSGRAIVAEHLRDWPNAVAFGPGVLHFHSRRAWRQSFMQAGLTIDAEHRITPFVAIFVLRRQS